MITMAKIPQMTRVEEQEFWESHDATDFLEGMEPVAVTRMPYPDTHCSVCGETMRSRYVDFEIADKRLQLRRTRELYCPNGHESRLAPEDQRLVDALEAVSRLAIATA